ncbi:MAG: bacteriohemerythrin [Ignavibacteriales bacterium]|nr:bacteriohemerythrin [Ignavibacteriales bacterium]
MALLTWNNTYSVNINSIDNQHKRLVDLMNNLHDAMKQGKGKDVLGEILNDLANYTVYHFNHEEKLFASHGYPEGNLHKAEHDKLIKQVDELKNKYNSGSVTVTLDVLNFLKNWLTDHIVGSDKKYSSFLNERGVN